MYRNISFKKIVIGLIVSFLILASVLLGAGYYYLRLFMKRSPLIIDGKNVAEIAKTYRDELIEKHGGREVNFTSSDGIILSGIFFKSEQARYNLVACHGYRGMKESFRALIELFPHANILIFDFRGHGQSGGDFISFGFKESLDVVAAVAEMRRLSPNEKLPLALLGVSMGGVTVLKAAAENPALCDAIIVDSPYPSFEYMMRRVAKRLLKVANQPDSLKFHHNIRPPLPAWLRKPFAYCASFLLDIGSDIPLRSLNVFNYVAKIHIPLLIIHSIGDETIPVRHAEALYQTAQKFNVPVQLWVAPSARHSYLHKDYPELYKEHVSTFLKDVFKK